MIEEAASEATTLVSDSSPLEEGASNTSFSGSHNNSPMIEGGASKSSSSPAEEGAFDPLSTSTDSSSPSICFKWVMGS